MIGVDKVFMNAGGSVLQMPGNQAKNYRPI
jgi:hypothetical protein